jgi:predicted PurR-regulated permease PerM
MVRQSPADATQSTLFIFSTIASMTQHTPKFSRLVSLGMLVLLIGVIGLLAFLVLWEFVLPLFLAGMAAVLFQPLNERLTKRLRGRTRAAAGITTVILFLCVMLPSLAIGALAVSETASLIQSLDRDALGRKIVALQNRLSLGPPKRAVVQALDDLDDLVDEVRSLGDAQVGPPVRDYAELRHRVTVAVNIVETELNLNSPEPAPPAQAAAGSGAASSALPADPLSTATASPSGSPRSPAAGNPPPERLVEAWKDVRSAIDGVKAVPTDGPAFQLAWLPAETALAQFRAELLGGPIAAWFKRNINLEPDVLQRLLERLRASAGPAALGTTQYLAGGIISLSIGLLVMLFCVYYFLADGRNMVKAVTKLTPLDDKYVTQLFEEFGNLTRAIVLSMLLAAGAQGLLAGIGYFVAGVSHVFLLTILTVVFAMLPLVGATFVWGSAAAWLYFIDGRPGAAIGLTIYCVIVVSLADNLVKPLVLQGKSNLHPLPALLSILGGVSALGPIGVFVGPMVMALLHTLLVMLRNELKTLETS